MKPVSLALFWHQHQPYYPDDVADETLMPWVRLHATKDYLGMAMHIQEVPEFHCTINLVPSLLEQIQRYENGHVDRHLKVSRMNADSLDQEHACYLLDNFFMANEQSMIRIYPRYHELFQKRGLGRDSAEIALMRFTKQELRDLQVWNNLTWIHELVFERDADLTAFRTKGRDWTEDEKNWLLDRQRELVAEVIPLHRELSEGGQVEITTTPFYHPILPLLWDKKSAREAMPGCKMPQYTDSYKEDVKRHLEKAVAYHTKLFGEPPRGLWPSEGSVSQDILASIIDVGIEWIATDEEILGHSTDNFVHRDAHGNVNRPELLYQPWKVSSEGESLSIIFRDHGLSDLIGFHYQRNDPNWAADDLLAKVKGIAHAVEKHNPEQPAFVPIVLDGENCWEYFPDGGVGFLRSLYRKSVVDPQVNSVRVSEFLAKHPPQKKINRLFAGSWINHDFYIWIGHQEDRDAWDLVHITRSFLKKAEKSGRFAPEAIQEAWKELMIAEGSDWYWWYGDDHHSGQDDLFDELFRRHLRNVYTLLGEMPPSVMFEPVTHAERKHLHTQPKALLNVKVDGRISFFEWLNAGHYEAGSERGTMTMVSDSAITDLYFGFDQDQFLLRCDTILAAKSDLKDYEEMRVRFVEPYGIEVQVKLNGLIESSVVRENEVVANSNVAAAIGKVLEVSIPKKDLGVEVGHRMHFAVELMQNGEAVNRIPSEGTIDLEVCGPDFERYMWQA
ncbi:glycoside hydrolase family 57 protein [Thalassoglobus sp. JC818]|uniref:glycoside hydrolase family 57 protein n=1 Tax=Thalassoglobus sp. JC818 TaxID=3232136 RepID=UPI003459D7E5